MDRTIPMLLIGLVFGGGLGFTLAAAGGVTLDGHDHSDPAQHSAMSGHADDAHDHGAPLDLPAGEAPGLAFDVTEDPVSGWNLHIRTRDFAFAPEHASGRHVAGEGHAHVYVNGTKLARVYGPWFHLPDLPKGPAEVTVTLNANDHRPLAVGGEPISQSVTLKPGS